jgi:hypothetical protein
VFAEPEEVEAHLVRQADPFHQVGDGLCRGRQRSVEPPGPVTEAVDTDLHHATPSDTGQKDIVDASIGGYPSFGRNAIRDSSRRNVNARP